MGNNGFQNCSPAAAAALPVLYMQLALTTKTKSSVQNWCLTLQVWPSSRAALWASTGLSMTRPVRPEKSMATREFSDTLRCSEEGGGGRCGGGRGEGKSEEGGRVRGGGRQGARGQTSQTQSLGHDKSCLHTGPLQHTGAALCWKSLQGSN